MIRITASGVDRGKTVCGAPRKHHYIPIFYLKAWAGTDGRVCQFSKPHSVVVPNRKHPAATGFMVDLYQPRGFPPSLAPNIEHTFFQRVDSLASEALSQMLNNATLSGEMRSAWSRFIMSLLLRCPEDIDALRESWIIKLRQSSPEAEASFQQSRRSCDPDTFSDFMASMPQAELEESLFDALGSLIDNPNIGSRLNGMSWSMLNTSMSRFTLLTSDRPIIRTNGIAGPKGHLAIPVGPDRLFVAANDRHFLDQLNRDASGLVRECNINVVEHAHRYVYGLDDRQMSFVEKRFARNPEPRLAEGTLERTMAEASDDQQRQDGAQTHD